MLLYFRAKLGFLFKRCGFLALTLWHTRRSAEVGLNRAGAGEMLEGNFAVDTAGAAERTNRFGERAGHSVLPRIRRRKVSVF